MKKILIISTVGLIYDGITSVIRSYLKAMDMTNFEIHIVSTIYCESRIKEELLDIGCRLLELPNRKKRPLQYLRELSEYIFRNKIDVVHVHGNSSIMTIELIAAYLGKCKKRIVHSHNTKCDHKYIDKFLRPFFYLLYTDALACGTAAGKWLFGKRHFMVLPNGRDIRLYQYNDVKRTQMRDYYKISNRLVIGHVGGFVPQKNHTFLIEIIRALKSRKKDFLFFMIGDGELRSKIEEISADIKEHIVFLGNIDNVSDYLNMMDVMVLPSLFEGMPLVVVEWQINGLPCIVSDVVTSDCKLTDLVEFVSLHRSADDWAEVILNISAKSCTRFDSEMYVDAIKKQGYDIQDSVAQLTHLYNA